MSHILGTNNKRTPLEAILKGVLEVPSVILVRNFDEHFDI